MMTADIGSEFARHYHEALAHHARGSLAAAAASLRCAIALAPGRAEPLIGLGVIATSERAVPRALGYMRRALAIDAGAPEAQYNAALSWEALGLSHRATAGYRRALARAPALAPAHDRLGGLLLRAAPSAAIAACRRATSCAPSEPGIWTNLGHALRAGGQGPAALDAWREAVRLAPLDPGARNNLGGLLGEFGRAGEARAAFRQVLALDPRAAEGHHNLAGQRGADQVIRLRRALSIVPDLAAAHVDLGVLHQAASTLDRAQAHYRRAVAAEPAHPPAHHNAATVLLQQGWTELADAPFRRAAMLAGSPGFHSDLLFYLCFKERPDYAAVFRDHVLFDQRFAEPLRRVALPNTNERSPDRVLRVGYVSANFQRHPVGHCLLGIFDHHDRRQVEVHAYAGNTDVDDMTERLRRQADGWHPILGLTDAELADRIRRDRIDILVDCIGHLPQGRLLAFARRPAPIQIGFPVYPNTSGTAALDYRITSVLVAPPEQDRFNTESLLRMPESHVVHEPSSDPEKPATEPPCMRTGHVTFGSFNNPAKLGPRTLAAWAEILKRVPTARLALKWKGLTYASLPIRTLAEHGIDIGRIEIRGWSPTAYAPYLSVDCCLDPFVNGGNTTYDALWMGTPLVTLRGPHLFARVGSEVLSLVGQTGLIADTADAYVDIAAGLGSDPGRIVEARKDLRSRLAASPALDAGRYTRHLESAYRAVWRRWCAGLPAAPIEIPALPRA